MTKNWKNVIWREWRYTRDRIIAQKLFDLVGNDRFIFPGYLLTLPATCIFFVALAALSRFAINNKNIPDPCEWSASFDDLGLYILVGMTGGLVIGIIWYLVSWRNYTWVNFLDRVVDKEMRYKTDEFVYDYFHLNTVTSNMLQSLVTALTATVVFGFIYFGLYSIAHFFSNLAQLILQTLFIAFILNLSSSAILSGVYSRNCNNCLELIIFMTAIGWFLGQTVNGLISGIILTFVLIFSYGVPLRLVYSILCGLIVAIMFSISPDKSTEYFLTGSGIGVFMGFVVFILVAIFDYSLTTNPGTYRGTIFTSRFRFFWWRKRPSIDELIDALFKSNDAYWLNILERISKTSESIKSFDELIGEFYSESLEDRFVARYGLLSAGTKPMLSLEAALKKEGNIVHEDSVEWIAREIARDNKIHVHNPNNLICPICITRFAKQSIRINKTRLFYYACRICQNSLSHIEGEIHSVLDKDMTVGINEINGIHKVNYLQRDSLFDFDKVEIIKADDYDVEKFCLRIGNDGDQWRKRRYKNVKCMVHESCGLSKKVIKILEDLFGKVVVKH